MHSENVQRYYFCAKCGLSEVTEFAEQRTWVREGCSLSPYLFNIFIDETMEYVSNGSLHVNLQQH
jgi:hypothetical protein